LESKLIYVKTNYNQKIKNQIPKKEDS